MLAILKNRFDRKDLHPDLCWEQVERCGRLFRRPQLARDADRMSGEGILS